MRTFALILCCIAVSACVRHEGQPINGEQETSEGVSTVRYVTDAATGCDYVIFDGYRNGGITPRLRPDGSPYCRAPQP
jgi:hypothetical protein